MAAEVIRIVGTYWAVFAVLAILVTLLAMRWSAYRRGRTLCAEVGHNWEFVNGTDALECVRCGASPY